MMKENFNSEFIDLIRDDEFIRLITESENPDQALANLILRYPENSKNIRYAYEFIVCTTNDRKDLNDLDFYGILHNIEHKLYEENPRKQKYHHFGWLRAASVFFALIALASILFYLQVNKNPLKRFADQNRRLADQSLIILSDGSDHILSNNDSKIDYNASRGEVIIKKNEKDEETLHNSSAPDLAVLNQVIVPYGQQQRVILSDGTSVRLNAGSKLVFPVTFSGSKREVYLKGEGFFEVYKDSQHPFIVKTDFVDIKVLGTTFDISAYDDENIASTVLVEGSVTVSQKNKVFGNKSFVLSPGQGCFYSINDKQSKIKDVDVNFYTSWKNGIYQFMDVSIVDVIRSISKYYNVSIQIEGKELSDTRISGKLIISGEITEVLQCMAKTLEGRFEKSEDGTYILKN